MSAANTIKPEVFNKAFQQIPLKDSSEADIINLKITFKNGDKAIIRRE